MRSWKTTRQPRPNVKHPLNAYQMPDRLRGGALEEDEQPEPVFVWILACVLVWCVALSIVWMVAQ